MTVTALSDEQLGNYERDGFFVLRNAVSSQAMAGVVHLMESIVDTLAVELLEAGEISGLYQDLPFRSRWAAIRAECPASRPIVWRRVLVQPSVHALWFEPALLSAAREVLGPDLWAHELFNGRPREPHDTSQTIDWHQDAFNSRDWNIKDSRILTFWIPLVEVDARSGCLSVVPGSHRDGLRTGITDEFGVTRLALEQEQVTGGVPVPMSRGDALVFDELMLHRSLDNVSDGVRWSVDIRYTRNDGAHRRKAPGGFRVSSRTREPETFDEWAAKWDPHHGVMRRELRRLDVYARSLGTAGRDVRVY